MAATVTLTFTTSSLAGRKLDLTRPGKYVIGRSSDCDIRLPTGLEFAVVPRHLAELQAGRQPIERLRHPAADRPGVRRGVAAPLRPRPRPGRAPGPRPG